MVCIIFKKSNQTNETCEIQIIKEEEMLKTIKNTVMDIRYHMVT